jgi:hypothetical protein
LPPAASSAGGVARFASLNVTELGLIA